MQQPRGFSIVVGVILGLAAVGVVASAVFLFRGPSPTPTTSNVNGVLQLSCSTDADCAAYCGTDSCYQATCATSAIGSTGSCTCRSTCGPTPSVNVNSNANTTVQISSFTECAAAGYPVMESYPRKCSAGGVLFTEVLANANTAANANASTAGWKTYTNTQYGFRFQYPPSVTVTATVTQFGDYSPLSLTFSEGSNSLGYWFEIGNATSTDTDALSVFETTYGFSDLASSVQKLSNVTVGSRSAVRYCLIPGHIDYCAAMFVQNRHLYALKYSDTHQLPNNILSTFTFTE